MYQKGLIIGFANQSRKRVLQGYIKQRVLFDNSYQISKVQGFVGDCKKEMQGEVIQMISEYPNVNTIYIVLKYQRIDIMRKQLSLIMEHFRNYCNNIYLVVANFQISKDKQKDQESIRTKLVEQNNLTNYFQYQFGQTCEQDSIYVDSQEIIGENIIHYFNKTICKQISFDGKRMNLYPKINYQLLQEIEQQINAGHVAIINSIPPEQIKDGILQSYCSLNEKQKQLGNDFRVQETNFEEPSNNSLILYENLQNHDRLNKQEYIIYQYSNNNIIIRKFNRIGQLDQQHSHKDFLICYLIELPQSPDVYSELKLIIPNQFFNYITINKITRQSYSFLILDIVPTNMISGKRKIKIKINPTIRNSNKNTSLKPLVRVSKLNSKIKCQ